VEALTVVTPAATRTRRWRPAPDPAADPATGRRGRRTWLVDTGWFVAALFVGYAMAEGNLASAHPAAPATRGLDVALGLAMCVALWWRRRFPVVLAVVGGAVGCFSLTGALAVQGMLFTVAVYRPTRVALIVAAADVLAIPAFAQVRGFDSGPPYLGAGSAALVTALVLGWGMFVRAQRQLVATLRERADRAEAEQQARAERARQGERTRIAREMHDVLAHRLSLLSVHAGALEFRSGADREQVRGAAGVIRATAHQALEDLRQVIGVLRAGEGGGAPEPPQPDLSRVPDLVAEDAAAGARVRYRCAVAAERVPPALGRTAYRVVQEGLTNARKHAPGVPVEVRVDGGGGLLLVTVANPLPRRAGPPVPGAGLGLVGLAERVTLAGGQLRHGPDGTGWFRLVAELPWTG
jgi:signal transduction histidine kinase